MFEYQSLLNIGYIFLYEIACAIFLPLPSEAPMFLFPSLSRLTVLVTCALGKGFGAYLVFILGDSLRQSKLFPRAIELLTKPFNSVIELLKLKRLWLKLSTWLQSFLKNYRFPGFLFLMAIPGMPMRSAIYYVSVLDINAIKFALGTALGTIIRNSLVYYVGYLGIKSLLY